MYCFALKNGFIVIIPLSFFFFKVLYGISVKDLMKTLRSREEAFHLKGLENLRIVELDEWNGA